MNECQFVNGTRTGDENDNNDCNSTPADETGLWCRDAIKKKSSNDFPKGISSPLWFPHSHLLPEKGKEKILSRLAALTKGLHETVYELTQLKTGYLSQSGVIYHVRTAFIVVWLTFRSLFNRVPMRHELNIFCRSNRQLDYQPIMYIHSFDIDSERKV